MHILLTGGGSGGHILPNVALLRTLQKQNIHTSYIGERGGMEEDIIRNERIPFHGIFAGKMRRYFSIHNLIDWFKIPVGICQAFFILLRDRPDKIFSKGGYVAVPVVIAGALLRIPIVIHESDVRPGLTTRLSSYFASVICVSWKATCDYFKGKDVRLTGVPVREELYSGSKDAILRQLHYTGKKPILLIVGGSLGAEAINTFIYEHRQELIPTFDIIHIAGKGKIPDQLEPLEGYTVFSLCGEEYVDILAAADIILSRAGSTALAEFTALQKKVILIPLPTLGSRGDQIDNAHAYLDDYPSRTQVITQKELTMKSLLHAIDYLKITTQKKEDIVQHALQSIVRTLMA